MATLREEYDAKVAAINTRIDGLNTTLTNESSEIDGQISALKTEIERLKEVLGETFDFSALDAIQTRLSESTTRISGLVDPVPIDVPPVADGTEEVHVSDAVVE